MCVLHGFPFHFSAVAQISPAPVSRACSSWRKSSEKLQGLVTENAVFSCQTEQLLQQAGQCKRAGFTLPGCSPTNPPLGMRKLCPMIKITLLYTFSKWSQCENVGEVKQFFRKRKGDFWFCFKYAVISHRYHQRGTLTTWLLYQNSQWNWS